LGPIKQGTMQGVFLFAGDIVNTVGPIAMTQVYALSGPTYIWAFQILAHILCVLMWYRVYPRMVPKSERTDIIVPLNLQPPIL